LTGATLEFKTKTENQWGERLVEVTELAGVQMQEWAFST